MGRQLTRIPLCGDCEDGWLVDGEGNLLERCPCRYVASPERAREAALASTARTNPDAFKAACRIVHDFARAMPVFSSNDCRAEMRIAQVPGETVGAAFRQAAKDRIIRADSYIPSTDEATHGHPVRTWASLIYRGSATA